MWSSDVAASAMGIGVARGWLGTTLAAGAPIVVHWHERIFAGEARVPMAFR